MRKGFIYTLDVLLALVVCALTVSAIMDFVSAPTLDTKKVMVVRAQDILAVCDMGGLIEKHIEGDPQPLDNFFNSVGDNVCMEMDVRNSSLDYIIVKSTGCGTPHDYVVVRRTVIVDDINHIARLRTWYR